MDRCGQRAGRPGEVERDGGERKPGAVRGELPGVVNANAAWAVLWAIAHNLSRAAGMLASTFHARATTVTIRAHLINVPARIARRARRLTLHLPQDWPWQEAWTGLHAAVHRLARAALIPRPTPVRQLVGSLAAQVDQARGGQRASRSGAQPSSAGERGFDDLDSAGAPTRCQQSNTDQQMSFRIRWSSSTSSRIASGSWSRCHRHSSCPARSPSPAGAAARAALIA